MPDPKYIISMGSCANSGGPYWEHGYHVLKGIDRVIPLMFMFRLPRRVRKPA
jgi:NADH-quinone oxidoreductase subunit B